MCDDYDDTCDHFDDIMASKMTFLLTLKMQLPIFVFGRVMRKILIIRVTFFMTVFLRTLVKLSFEQNYIVVTILIRVLTISMTVFMFDNFDESSDNVDKTFDKFWCEPERLKRQFHEKAKGGKWRGQIHGEKSCRINFIKRSMTGIHEKWKWKIH